MNVTTCLTAVVGGLVCLSARAGAPDWRFSLQGSLGATSGDLKDTTNGKPCLGLGAFAERPTRGADVFRARLDGLFMSSAHRTGSGSSEGVPWTRRLDTRVQGWSLGAEYLVGHPFGLPRLAAGGGLAVVRWTVDSTSTLVFPGTGSVVEASKPAWTKVGVTLVADYRMAERLRAQARMLTCPYGWEGERVNVWQMGLAWTF